MYQLDKIARHATEHVLFTTLAKHEKLKYIHPVCFLEMQLNCLLARGDDELDLFATEDLKLRGKEIASWQALMGDQVKST